MDIFVQLHIYKKSLKLKKNISKDFVKILKEIEEKNSTQNTKVRFSFLKDGNANYINAGSAIKGYVLFNAEWAAYLILFNDTETNNAFMITLGHELTHKDGDFPNKLQYSKLDRKFINWTNEVHADFGATQKYFNANRKILINSCEYKKQHKKQDKDWNTHPSWKKRKYYAEHFNFNSKLIKQIAKDIGCENNDLINQVSKYYSEIILEDN